MHSSPIAPMDFTLEYRRRWQPELARPQGQIRASNEDFQVDEILGFEPTGAGEHLYMQIRKNGQNSVWVKEQIARQLGIKARDIGHSGLKDRHAVTTQWLSLYAPVNEPDLECLSVDGVEILQATRHSQKLRPGTHRANRFALRVRGLSDTAGLEDILARVRAAGFPNYFGAQRFGIDGANLPRGWQLLHRRQLRQHKNKSIYLSALRSFLFNQVLSARIEAPLDVPEMDASGPLWGRGTPPVSELQREYERGVLQPWQPLVEALEHAGLQQERRDLFQVPQNMRWDWTAADQLYLQFELPPGGYATALLQELIDWPEFAPAR